MKKIIALSLAVLMAVLMFGCQKAPESADSAAPAGAPAAAETPAANTEVAAATQEEVASGKYQTDMRIGSEEDLETADPYASTTASTQMFTNSTFNTLVANEVGTGNILPELASSWDDVNGDGTVWDLHLVENAVFHDGSPFTADDVVFTWSYITDATKVVKVFSGACVTACQSVEAVDAYTARFTLAQPMPDFISYLEIKIYSKTAFDTLGAEKAASIGTGPYYYNAELTKDAIQFVASRFDQYWGDNSLYPTQNLVYVVLQNADTMVAALQTGEVDAIFAVVANQVSNLESDSNVTIYTAPGAYSYYMGFNYRNNADFQDHDFRVALMQAIDKDALVAVAFEGYATASNCLVTPIALGYSPDYTFAAHDPAAAKAYFEANGYAGKSYVLSYPTQATKLMAEVIQANLAEVGIHIELKQVDVTNWTTHKGSNDYDMFLDAIGMQGALLYNVNRIFYTGGSSNQYGHSNPDYEAAQNAVTAQTTWADMLTQFKVLQQFIADECAVAPLLYDTFIYAVRSDVQGLYVANSKNFSDFSTLYALAR